LETTVLHCSGDTLQGKICDVEVKVSVLDVYEPNYTHTPFLPPYATEGQTRSLVHSDLKIILALISKASMTAQETIRTFINETEILE